MAEMGVDAVEARGAKRQKFSTNTSPAYPKRKPGDSRVFAPHRTLGLVSPTPVPFTSVPLGKTTFQITTSVGRSLQTYDLRRGLNLVFITRPLTPGEITASVAWKDKVLAAWCADAEGTGKDADGKGTGRGVWVFRRGKREAELEAPKNLDEDIKALRVFGSWIVGLCEKQILIWKSVTYELYTTLRGLSPLAFTSCIASLPTYLNKVIVGRGDGTAELWNISSGKQLYTILPSSSSYGAVTALEPTPALSLVAIAYANGVINIHDFRTDTPVISLKSPTAISSLTFRTDLLGAGDAGEKAGMMATASTSSGDVTLWDLNDGGRRAGVLRSAHASPTLTTPGGVSKIQFLPGQAVLVSSGLDNSLKTWIFDQVPFSPIPRILHARRGHGAPVSKLLFLPSASDGSDDTGKWLLSASQDRSLWGWSLRRDGQSTELSQGNVQSKAKLQGLLSGDSKYQELKCPPITAIACSLNRDGGVGALPGKQPIWQDARSGKGKRGADAEVAAMTGWESVVTAHEGDGKARTWFWGRKRAGRWVLPTSDGGTVSAVAMSACGTFAVVGSAGGGVDVFNLQSGQHRQRFPARLTATQARQLRVDLEKAGFTAENEEGKAGKKTFYRGQGRHTAPVVGLSVDALNRTLVTTSTDGKVKFWDFTSGLLEHELNWSTSTGISGMRLHRSTELAAFACTDGCIRVLDIGTRRLVRELWPSRSLIPQLQGTEFADFNISDDARWIVASLDRVVLLWDLPTGHLVDAFKLASRCRSLGFSPTGEFLATASDGGLGVDVWTNRTMFANVALRRIGEEELAAIVASDESVQAPTASGEGGESLIAGATEARNGDEADADLLNALGAEEGVEADADQLSSNLLSLSLVPRSRWQNLLHLDLIRQRNKPIEPPKRPEKAPFFLPSLQDRQSKQHNATEASNPADAAALEKERSRVLRYSQQNEQQSTFSTLLSCPSDPAPFIAHLKSLSPAAADIAIRSLSLERNEHVAFVHALTWLLQRRADFEVGQVWMSVFLRLHGDVVTRDEAVREAVEVWREALELEQRRVGRLLGYCKGVGGYLRAPRV